jgi:thiamine biosynthesis lipoprotein
MRLTGPFRTALWLTVLLFATLQGGCSRDRVHRADLYVFGTLVNITLYGASDSKARRAFSDVQEMFQGMHGDWHAWEPGMLTEINQAFANRQAIEAGAQIVHMIRESQLIEARSGGRFNPAIGGLIREWGFHTSDYPIIGPPPAREDIDKWLSRRPSSRDIDIVGLQLASTNPAVQLDFGGIAKGYAVDLAMDYIRYQGIDNAIVNAGGDLRAMGRHGDRPWRIAVRKPGGGIIGAVEVRGDEALFTSGNYERFRQDATRRYPHIIDPRTGWPVRDIASATVITDEGLLADAAATALIVAGLEDWPEVARSLELDQVMIIDEQGKVYLTPKMADRVRFTEPVQQQIITP